jgi:hypothetical protein
MSTSNALTSAILRESNASRKQDLVFQGLGKENYFDCLVPDLLNLLQVSVQIKLKRKPHAYY